MYLPVELQKHILSYLNPNADFLKNSKGRCIARNKTDKHPRCKRKVDFTNTLTCPIHHQLGDVFSCHNSGNTVGRYVQYKKKPSLFNFYPTVYRVYYDD